VPIRYRLFIAFGIVLIGAAAVALYGIQAIAGADRLVVRLYDEPFMAVSHAREAQAKFNEARSALEHGAAPQDVSAQATSDAIEAAVKDIIDDLDVVAARMRGARGATDKLGKARALTEDWRRSVSGILARGPEGLRSLSSTDLFSKSDMLAGMLDEIVEAANAYGFAFRSAALAEVASSRLKLIVLACGTGIIAVLLSFATSYSFVRPIRQAMVISEQIAAGDLFRHFESRRTDEVGRLMRSLGKMQDALRTQVESTLAAAAHSARESEAQIGRRQALEAQIAKFRAAVQSALDEVEDMTGAFTTTARRLAEIAHETDARIKEAAGGAEETSSNVTAVASASEQLNTSAREIMNQLEQANGVVQSGSGMTEDAVSTILDLSDATKAIDDVVGLIHKVAEQTNLLALNATIEAARAGDAGRGFAVVAAEVKQLASQTGKATQEISARISGVRASTVKAVQAVQSISSVMAGIRDLTRGIGVTLEQQGDATEEISMNVSSAATATQGVARSVMGVAASARETSNSAADVLASAQRLAAQSSLLRASVHGFLRDVAG
jgi:methyl-accepting chemotaxis protein